MTLYLDTSAFVPCSSPSRAARLPRDCGPALCGWCRPGCCTWRPRPRWRALRELDRLHEDLDLVEVRDALVRRAADLAARLHLRGYDAVHCASAEACADDDLVVAAGDRRLLDACARLGPATSLVG